jgi:hypothetical protein
MPKQILKIDQFHGGLNSNADPRDIAPNELSVGTDIMIDELGKVRNMGGITSAVTANAAVMEAGYGLFHFSHDRLGATTSGTGQDDTGDDYLAMADTATSSIDIYSNTTTAWGTAQIDLGGGTGGMKAIFYVADGSLRVSDAAFGVANKNQWFGYIERTHFSGVTPGGSADAYDGWYYKNVALAKPTKGLYGQTVAFTDTTAVSGSGFDETNRIEKTAGGAGNDFTYWTITGDGYIATDSGANSQARIISGVTSGNDTLTTEVNGDGWGGESIRIFPPAGTGWNVYLKQSSTTGGWPGQDYQVGTTFIYQGNQESEVFSISDRPNATGRESIATGFAIDFAIYAVSPFDPFLIGGRVYVRKFGTDDPWILLADISLVDGVRTDLTSGYTAWTLDDSVDNAHNNAPDNVYCYVEGMTAVDPSPWSYEAINGYRADESISIGTVGEGFKTAVVANRQVYIGNVKRLDEDGVKVQEGDAMYKSAVNKFDTFPISRKIEASVQDGDEIVKLEEYADRILQFKKNKMHLINISQDVEFLEDTFIHKGIVEPAAACKTDFGIAWVNELGAYLYDGKKVTNLLEKDGRQMIKESDWSTFVGGKPTIGYIAKKRQILVGSTTGTGSDGGDIYLYDLVTRSWVQGKNKIVDGVKRTNFVVDWNGDLVCAHTTNTGTVVKWDDASDASSNVDFQTKDIDFGQPGQRKKIYKVYITYRGRGTHTQVHYGVDGLTPALTFNNITSGTDGSSTGSGSNAKCIPYDAGTTDWLKAELKPSAAINNISSFRLKISGDGSNTVSADFEINDISIVYRLKNIK